MVRDVAVQTPAMSTVPSIPPELIELIIGFVRGRSTLRACSLVGHDFLRIAQERLYSEVILSPPKRRGPKSTKTIPAQRFLNIINSSPYIANFVKTLNIHCQDSINEQPWLYTDTALQHILPRLTRLERISVNGKVREQHDDESVSSTKANLSWTSLSPSLRAALVSLMRSGSVIDLELGGFSRIPISSVIQSCSLKKLSLLPLYVEEEKTEGSELAAPSRSRSGRESDVDHVQATSHLEDITIKQSSVALRRTTDWLLRPGYGPSIDRLEKFCFTVANNDDHRHIAQIVDACSSSLKQLEINPGPEISYVRHLIRKNSPIGPPASPLHLSNLRELRSLKINTEIRMYKLNNNRYSDPLPWVVSLLASLPADNQFTTFELNLDLHLNKQIWESISWMKLVHMLSSDHFPHFERLVLTLGCSESSEPLHEEAQMLPHWVREVVENNAQLSDLRDKGLLCTQF